MAHNLIMSTFAGKQTFITLNSNVCFILKADVHSVQLESFNGVKSPLFEWFQ